MRDKEDREGDARQVAVAAIEETSEAAALRVAVVCGVGPEDKEQAEHAADQEVGAWCGDHTLQDRLDGLWPGGIDYVNEDVEDGVGDEMRADGEGAWQADPRHPQIAASLSLGGHQKCGFWGSGCCIISF